MLAVRSRTTPLPFETNEPTNNHSATAEHLSYAALLLSRPFHWCSEGAVHHIYCPLTPGKHGNYDSEGAEAARRVFAMAFYAASLPITVSLALAGGFLDYASQSLASLSYLYLKGTADEASEENGDYTFLTNNACMFWGGIPRVSGLTPASERIDRYAAMIRDQDPDFVMLQEVSFGPGLALYEKLKDRYAHFYTHIGPNPWKMESGLFFASKYPIIGEPKFIPFPNQNGMKRGIFCVETPFCCILTTHMEPGSSAASAEVRKEQLALITETMKQMRKQTQKPCFVLGDLNINRTGEDDCEYADSEIEKYYHDHYTQHHEETTEENSTYTNRLAAYSAGAPEPETPWEHLDYALCNKGAAKHYRINARLIRDVYSDKNPEQALTDHRPLVYRVRET